MNSPNILLVDDDKNFLRVLTHLVQGFGVRASPAASGEEALQRMDKENFDLVITDLRMPEMDGMELMERVKARDLEMPVLVLTAHGSIDRAVEAIKKGAFDFLTKPFDKEEVHLAIANALKMAQLVRENRTLSRAVRRQFSFEGIIGSSKKFREVLELAQQLADVETTVLIQGETGTGKELLARAIHFHSERRKNPLIVVNCGAIPEELVESELFGHKKGSFTGAIADKKGKFETAHKGTIFLDEVGELPPNAQVKLLRVLQEKEIDVVGEPKPRKVDVRILAATNRDLLAEMQEGQFREDLYYRLAVAPLQMPPLRERQDDLPLLAHYFLDHFNRKFGKRVAFEPPAIDALQSHDWPGNVRELENIIHRLVVFDQKGTVTSEDLAPFLHKTVRSCGRVIMGLPEEGISLEELERDLLLAALEEHDWNQTRAAAYLGITRNTLLYRMQKFDLRKLHP